VAINPMDNNDHDVASLVVALMGPFEDRISLLESEVRGIKENISHCVTLEDFLELQSRVSSVETKQKADHLKSDHHQNTIVVHNSSLFRHPPQAAAVMSSHTMRELGACQEALKSQPPSPQLQGSAGPAGASIMSSPRPYPQSLTLPFLSLSRCYPKEETKSHSW